MESGEPLLVDDVDDPRLTPHERAVFVADGFSRMVTVPLRAAGANVGILEVFDHRYEDLEESLRFITAVGQMIAGWIQSAALVGDLERQSKLSAELVELGTLVSRTHDVRGALQSLGERLMTTIDADAVEICVVRGERIHFLAGFDHEGSTDTWGDWSDELANYPLTAAALESHEPLVIVDLKDPRLSEHERRQYRLFGYQGEILLPLVVEDRAIGYLDIWSREPRDLSEFATFLRSAAPVLARVLENSVLLDEIQRRNEALRELVLIGELLAQTLELTELLRLVALRLLVATDATGCDIYRIDGDELHHLVSIGSEGFDEQWVGRVLSLSDYPGSAGAIRSGEIVVVRSPDDPRLNEDEREIYRRHGVQSSIAVPLVVGGRAVGLIDLDDAGGRDFTEHADFLRNVARLLAGAFEKAVLLEQLEQGNRGLRELVDAGLEFGASLELDDVLRSVAFRTYEALEADCVDIYAIEGDDETALISVENGAVDETFAGHRYRVSDMPLTALAMARLEPVATRDITADPRASDHERAEWAAYGVRSGVQLPLVTRREVIGMMDVQGRQPRDFEAREVARGLAQIAAQAIANASVHAQLEQTARRTALMTEASVELSSSLDLSDTLLRVGTHLSSVIGVPNVDVNLMRPDGTAECIVSTTDGEIDPAWTGAIIDLERFPILGEVVETRRPIVIESLDDPRVTPAGREISERFGEKSWLSVPLIAKDRVIGLVDLIETRRERFFSDEEIETAQAVCQVAALAIDNAAMYDRLEETARRMTMVSEAGMEFSSSLDLNETLFKVGKRLCEIIDVQAADIHVLRPDGSALCIMSLEDGEIDADYTGSVVDVDELPGITHVLETSQPEVVQSVDDPSLSARGREMAEQHGEKSWLTLPLVAGDHVLGMVSLFEKRRERSFTEEEIETALAVCQVAALAIDNASTHAELEKAARRTALMTEASLEFSLSLNLKETLLAVGRRLCDTVGVPNCDINVLTDADTVRNLLSIVGGKVDPYWTGTSMTITDFPTYQKVINDRRVVVVTSPSDAGVSGRARALAEELDEKSWVTLPLVAKDRVIGVVELIETRHERTFDDDEIETALAVCQAAALAIENADLYESLQARGRETEMLNAIASRATASLDVSEIVLDATEELQGFVPFARSYVTLLEDDEIVVYRPASGDVTRRPRSEFEGLNGTYGKRISEEGVVFLEMPDDSPMGADHPSVRGLRSAVSIALRTGGRLMGALNLGSTQADAYATTDPRVFERIGTQLSLAIKNALLYADIKRMHLNNLRALSAALNAKDYYTIGHAARVSAYMVLLGQKLGWSTDLLQQVEGAAYLHDIGKIGISDRVLLKPGKLNAEEWTLMKQHPVFSADIIRTLFDEDLVLGVRHHHERWDGGGYPDGLKGERTSPIARAMCVADSYDAMSFQRPYRNALDADQCLDELRRCRGSQWDPEMTDAFLEVLAGLEERRQKAVRIAREAARRIDPHMHARLQTPEDEKSKEYAAIAAILRDVRDANPPTRFVTTQTRLNRRYVIIVDAEENEEDRSHIGEDIFPDEILQVLPKVLAGEDPRVNALFADQYGVWVSGLAPIRDDGGEIAAVVAADLPPYSGAALGVLRTRGDDSLASILQTAAIRSTRAEVDTITDGLTGLYNHRYLHERLDEELARCEQEGTRLSILYGDLDRFKEFNEQAGHRAGDNALRSIAHIVEQSIRAVDLASRYGGEEFVVALLETGPRGAFEVAERICQRVRETWVAPSQEPLSISIGVVTYPADGTIKDELLDKADWAMNVAKRQGRNRVVAFSPAIGDEGEDVRDADREPAGS
jgi:diguanylate cyclase (GGDEF)-like protein